MTDTSVKRRTNNADRTAARAARDAAEAIKPKIGRPTSFTPEVQEEILRRLEAGETLMRICADPHLPRIGRSGAMQEQTQRSVWPLCARERVLRTPKAT